MAYRNITAEVPALAKLKLDRRGSSCAGAVTSRCFRVRVPGPDDLQGGARATPGSRSRSRARTSTSWPTDGKIEHWREAYEHGDIKVAGDHERPEADRHR